MNIIQVKRRFDGYCRHSFPIFPACRKACDDGWVGMSGYAMFLN